KMSKDEARGNLQQLGLDVDSSQMMLKGLMAAAGGPSKFVTYKEIAAHLEKLEKKKYTKAYIYRRLTDLENEGFIVVDTIQHPKQFSISEAGIVRSLKKKRKMMLSEIETKRQEVTTKQKLLTTTNPENVAMVLYNQLVGLDTIEESVVIEGIESVRNTVIREFGEVSKPGDEIRVIAPASVLDRGLGKSGMAEMSLMARAMDGVKIIGLLMPIEGKQSRTTELILSYIQNVGEAFVNLASTGNISLRIAKENSQTYRMVSLNSDKMLLYLTHAVESDTAALIQRKDNPGLIDDAVKTFDTIFDEAIDIMDIVKQALSGNQ
ncbi:MAG: hypothetical protein KAJ36_06475, partial [Candidatus Thorarchaeota archaeon]|nr:hypothetical protein [Candidatus Thorarchaeota archaeon]